MNNRPICFILLNYDPNSHRHWFHLYHFIETLAATRRVQVLIEHSEQCPTLKHVERVIRLKRRSRIGRLVELTALLVLARARGFSVFYNHYTFGAARLTGLITRISGGSSYLWHCIPVKELDFFTNSSRLQQVLFHLTLKLVHYVVTGSEYMAEYYQKNFRLASRKTVVVPNYLDLTRFEPSHYPKSAARSRLNLDIERPIFLYLHEMEPGRSLALPDVIRGILSLRPDSFFLLVGGGSYQPDLQRLLADLVQQGTVRFTGAVPNLEIPWYYAAADVYLVTSKFEAFSRTLLEAMAMGIPIASTDGGGFTRAYTPEILHRYLLPYERIDELASVAVQFLENSVLRADLIAKGRAQVAQYSEPSVLKIFERQIR